MSLRDVLARNVVGRRVAAGLIVLGIAAGSAAVVVPLTDSDSADNAFELRVVSETATTIRFAWDPQPGFGYLFSLNGQLVSRTNDPSRSEVKFAKGDSYEVAVIAKGAIATYPPVVTQAAAVAQAEHDIERGYRVVRVEDGNGKTVWEPA